MKKKKVFVTGMAGYVGGVLCRELDRAPWCESFCGMDIKKPLYKYRKGEFRQMDINDPALGAWVAEEKPDILVHLAFVLNPIQDETLMTHINVDGTRNTLSAITAARVPQALIVSSATAYGAFADNPVPIREQDPIRPHPHFSYARDKAVMEDLCAGFSSEHPEVALSIIRPCIIYGPHVDNYLSFLFTLPLGLLPSEHDTRLQFVHEDDVVGSILHILEKDGRGPYNVAPGDTVSIREVHELAGRKILEVPDWVAYRIFDWTWKLKLPIAKVPPTFYDYVRYPWVLDNTRLTSELGYNFQYSTRETIEIMFRAKNIRIKEPEAKA
ncbi:MAG: NAD-dependent epimerase/dehydratase family protein [Thermodesulfobacteriota bacterium]